MEITIQELLTKYCDFSEEEGYTLKPDAPEEAVKLYQAVIDPQPDDNGVITLID